MRKKVLYSTMALAVWVLVLLVASACAPKTVIVEKQVEKIVTQIVKEVVQETVVVAGTPQVVEKEVTKVVEKEVQVVVQVTPTPEMGAVGQVQPIPRSRTLILGQWGFGANLSGTDTCNPLMERNCVRNNYAKFAYEALFYNDLNSGQEYPWLATAWGYNDDYTEMTIDLRKGVEWADGEPLTCDDVKFTFEAFDQTDGSRHKAYFNQWMESVDCADDFSVLVTLKAPNSRFHQKMMVGHENHIVILPEHIWSQAGDLATFKNFDLAKGWPMGSGPYKAVLVTAQQIVWDLREDWWGAKIGFMELPKVERIIATTSATDESTAQMYIANKMDYGMAIQIGSFEAARDKNPNLRTWANQGPVYGAPDGCNYQLMLNDETLFGERNVRVAMNYAIDRQQIVELGYQGAVKANVAPFSSYILGAWGPVLKEVYDKYERGVPNADMVDELMTEAGYAKNGDGYWAKNGEVLHFNIMTQRMLAPIGPVVSEQLTKAGFSNEENMDTSNQFRTKTQMGDFDVAIEVHCGSLYDPWDTLQEFHSKWVVPVGEPSQRMPFGPHRYAGDPDLDAALDYMEANVPSTTDAKYVEMAKQALDRYFDEMPQIILAEELHVIPMNQTFWTGWPNEDDPYIAPYPCWQDFTLSVFHLEPTQ